MYLPPRFALLLVALTFPLVLPYDAAAHPAKTTPHARVPVDAASDAVSDADDRPFGAECRTAVDGSYVTAYCHNPYPEPDRVRLHIECDRWWDIDSDGAPIAAGPAQTVRLTGRCWQEVRSAWVSHQR